MNLPTKVAKAPSGDFIGFSFAGVHSSDLGICRTSDGNRYNDTFLPTIQDKTVQVPGGDGTYYFGSYFTQKPFSIPIAFDCMTEAQYQYFKELFGDKKIHPLVFDDHPYKTYYVKVTGSPQLKTVCFDMEFDDLSSTVKDLYTPGQNESGVVRIYKGEGVLSFTAYYPYAESDYNYLDDYFNAGWTNYAEWAEASKLPENRYFYKGEELVELQKFSAMSVANDNSENEYFLRVATFNKTSPLQWKMRIPIWEEQQSLMIRCFHCYQESNTWASETVGELHLSDLSALVPQGDESDKVIIEIDTEKRLIKRIRHSDWREISEICNYKIVSGDFFTLPNEGYYIFEISGYDSNLSDNFTEEYENITCMDYKYRYL